MPSYSVHVTIENKPGINDPEGETILKDLVMKKNYSFVTNICSAKMLKFRVKEKNKKSAADKVRHICDDLRIYNPMVSQIRVDVFDV